MHDHNPDRAHVVISQGRPFCLKCADYLESVPQHLVPEFIKDKYNINRSEVKSND